VGKLRLVTASTMREAIKKSGVQCGGKRYSMWGR
jgi:hypothetical protein